MSEPQTAIIFITRKWPPAMGGMETYCWKLVEQLRKRRVVQLIALPGAPDGRVPRPRQLVHFGFTTAARLLFGKPLPELMHISDMASWPFGLVGRWRRPSIRIVISAHGTDVSYGRRSGWRGRLYTLYLRAGARLLGCAEVIANSDATAEVCRQIGFDKVRVVPLASDLRPPKAAPTRGNNLLFAGRLTSQKGLSWFVENVLPRLPSDVGLEVAGVLWSEKEAASLCDRRVRYVGVLEEQELAKAFAGALCVVVPNVAMSNGEFEGFGLVAVEAAAAGGVVLASNIGGLRSAVIDGVTGFLVEPGNDQEWASRIAEIKSWGAAERDTFVASSVAAVRTHYSWERVARETETVYGQEPLQG